MECGAFLADYSDFRDGLLAWDVREACEAHLEACASCARYDRVVRRGTDVLRDLPELEVSDDFQERLQHRLYHVDEERSPSGRRASTGAAAATLSVAAMIALAAWVPMMLPGARGGPTLAVDALPPVQARPYAWTADAPPAHDGLAARLEEVGVKVYPLPYRDLLYGGSPLVTLASYDASGYGHD